MKPEHILKQIASSGKLPELPDAEAAIEIAARYVTDAEIALTLRHIASRISILAIPMSKSDRFTNYRRWYECKERERMNRK
jgi:hypothetical protein